MRNPVMETLWTHGLLMSAGGHHGMDAGGSELRGLLWTSDEDVVTRSRSAR